MIKLCGGTLLLALASTACTATGPAPGSPAQQRGFALVTYAQYGYDSPQTAAYLRQIADTGARWVQIIATWYQADPVGSDIVAGPQTPADASLVQVIAAAHRLGLKVLVKPAVDLTSGDYRGTISPADRNRWFDSYTRFITHYAELSAGSGAEEFSVGAELPGVSADRAGWLRVIAAVRATFHGPLVYSANFDEYSLVAFWDNLDLIGISAYWKLSRHPTRSVAALRRAWTPIEAGLAAFAAQHGRSILFTEAGYTSQRGTTTAPSSWSVSATPDDVEQAAAYQALLASFQGKPWWAGVFWWSWDVPLDDYPNDPLGYTPHGKAAEQIVRRWWAVPAPTSSGPTPTPSSSPNSSLTPTSAPPSR